MKTEEGVLAILENTDTYVSGEEIAGKLGVSRNAVWKAIGLLRSEGYVVEAVTRKGYRLVLSDRLTKSGIQKYLQSTEIFPDVRHSLTSTNTVLKTLAEDGAPEGYLLAADIQTAGRGRQGRSFFSPDGTGVYVSLLLRPETPAEQSLCLTACAAVAVVRAIKALTGRTAQIKWVNDIFCDGKKVCGILTEASVDMETGQLRYAIPGIGVNLFFPKDGFGALSDIATAILPYTANTADQKCRMAAYIADTLWSLYREGDPSAWYREYREKLFVLGKKIKVFRGGTERNATAVDMDENYRLLVEWDDQSREYLSSGEIRIRPDNT